MVIEFIGIPGSGKTHFCKYLLRTLNLPESRDIVEASRTVCKYKILFKLLQLECRNKRFYKELKAVLKKLLKPYAEAIAEFNTVDIYSYIDSLIFYCFLTDKLQAKKELYLLDEGILQQIINMYVNFDISEETINEIIDVLSLYIHSAYIRCTLEISKRSIKERNRHVCYIDEIHGEKLNRFLAKYMIGCEIVGKVAKSYILNRDELLENNVDHLIKWFGI